MLEQNAPATPEAVRETAYEAPGYETLALACEISAYAPDSGDPLF
jgi:hypothetical protein